MISHKTPHPASHAFTRTELIVILSIIIVLTSILLPALTYARRQSRLAKNANHHRGIWQGFLIFSQSSVAGGGFSHYAGLNRRTGEIHPDGSKTNFLGEGDQPVVRVYALIHADVITDTQYLISPADTQRFAWDPTGWQPKTKPTFNVNNYSYAVLGIAGPDGEIGEWKETNNPDAVILSDRAIGTGPHDAYSIWTAPGHGWQGHAARNDGSVHYESSPILTNTRYMRKGDTHPQTINANDDLFTDTPGTPDAIMVHPDANTTYSQD